MKPRLPAGKDAARLERRLAQARAKAEAAALAASPGRLVNLTDPDSRLMKTTNGWAQGYNAQAVVNYVGIVVVAEVFTNTSDNELFRPMVGALSEAEAITGAVGVVLADAGYCSAANLAAPGPVRLISTRNERRTRADTTITHGPAPEGLSHVGQMQHAVADPRRPEPLQTTLLDRGATFRPHQAQPGLHQVLPPRPAGGESRVAFGDCRRQPGQTAPLVPGVGPLGLNRPGPAKAGLGRQVPRWGSSPTKPTPASGLGRKHFQTATERGTGADCPTACEGPAIRPR